MNFKTCRLVSISLAFSNMNLSRLMGKIYESKRDVILFCIDCSESMLRPYDDHKYEETVQTCHLYNALDAAMQIQKKKILVGPNDSVGILLFNTVRPPIPSLRLGDEMCA